MPQPKGCNLAYCIYTSGSTGRPKGTLLEHKGLLNYTHASLQRMQGITQDDVILQKTPYVFDVSLWEFAIPLTCAAKLLMAKHEGHKDPSYVIDAIRRGNVTVTRFIPSVLDLFLQQLQVDSKRPLLAEPLRLVGCSGEALRSETALSFLQVLPAAELYDLYGPTEATVDVTGVACTGRALRAGKTIGSPLSGVKMYIAASASKEDAGAQDQGNLQKVPMGIPGELLIGGCQLARGYLHLPERTAKVFTPNPFLPLCPGGTDARVYHTGDLAKWRADGEVVYLGRKDRQVKLHGVRIELEDVESVALQAEGVKEALAKMHVDDSGKSFVLFVVPSTAATQDVLCHCRKLLPDRMVPTRIVGVDEWPRTASGKIDQKCLSPGLRKESDKCRDGTFFSWAIDVAENAAFSAPSKSSVQDSPSKVPADVENHQAWENLADKIKSEGILAVMQDEEVQHQGWNSFQIMKAHGEISRGEKLVKQVDHGEVAVMSIVGHIWFITMVLVMLEWAVAFWEWYGAVPGMASFHLHDYPVLSRLNALGRLVGDPFFVMLSSIQDMADVKARRTGPLCRRAVLFLVITVVGTFLNKWLLQGPFMRYGLVDAAWALDTTKMCGVLNGSVFLFARAVFLAFAIVLSVGDVGWIRLGSVVEWPVACLGFALFVPAVVEGISSVNGFGNGGLLDWMRACKGFIVELSPYYFLYPCLIGGTAFPQWLARLKANRSNLSMALSVAGFVVLACTCHQLKINDTSDVDYLQSRHVPWAGLLQEFQPQHRWPLLELVKKSFDLYAAMVVAIIFVALSMLLPTKPSDFSLLGTRCIGCYLTMPLSLTAAGHFMGPILNSLPQNYQTTLVPCGVMALLLLLTILMSQQILPTWLLDWAATGKIDLQVGLDFAWPQLSFGDQASEPLLKKARTKSRFFDSVTFGSCTSQSATRSPGKQSVDELPDSEQGLP